MPWPGLREPWARTLSLRVHVARIRRFSRASWPYAARHIVEWWTAPLRPAWATSPPSRSCTGVEKQTWRMPCASADRRVLRISIDVVPKRIGRPRCGVLRPHRRQRNFLFLGAVKRCPDIQRGHCVGGNHDTSSLRSVEIGGFRFPPYLFIPERFCYIAEIVLEVIVAKCLVSSSQP